VSVFAPVLRLSPRPPNDRGFADGWHPDLVSRRRCGVALGMAASKRNKRRAKARGDAGVNSAPLTTTKWSVPSTDREGPGACPQLSARCPQPVRRCSWRSWSRFATRLRRVSRRARCGTSCTRDEGILRGRDEHDGQLYRVFLACSTARPRSTTGRQGPHADLRVEPSRCVVRWTERLTTKRWPTARTTWQHDGSCWEWAFRETSERLE